LEKALENMASLLKAFGSFFTKHPLAGNGLVYGTLYVGAEFSQQTITRKFLIDPPQDIDRPTLARYAIMGTFIYSPILYNCFIHPFACYLFHTFKDKRCRSILLSQGTNGWIKPSPALPSVLL
uniref:Uncharacterized protein n=1 Tax=Anopheles atroparvus TaxID=41427 RepID=A0A182J0I7_ANOAO